MQSRHAASARRGCRVQLEVRPGKPASAQLPGRAVHTQTNRRRFRIGGKGRSGLTWLNGCRASFGAVDLVRGELVSDRLVARDLGRLLR
jgi:hypothetical protein